MTTIVSILFSNLLIAGVIALIATLVGWSGRRAAVAHLLWMAVFLKFVTPPVLLAPVSLPSAWLGPLDAAENFLAGDLSLSMLAQPAPASAHQAASARPSAQASGQVGGEVSERMPGSRIQSASPGWPSISVATCLVSIWVVGASVLIMRGTFRFVRFSKLLRREGVFDAEASQIVRRLLRGDRPGFAPPVCLIAARVSPMLYGMGRATWIVCPDSLWASLSDFQRRAFLAHEVAHYQRRDHWVRWLEWLVTAIYWWMPLIYLARLQLERHEEAACDAWALARLGKTSPRWYAETLLSVVDFLSESRTGSPRLASRMQPTGSLEERLRLIMQWREPHGSAAKQHVALAACCVALLVVHPTPQPSNRSLPTVGASTLELAATDREQAGGIDPAADSDSGRRGPLIELPPSPLGWWNATPGRTWADQVLGENELHLLAQVGIGIGVRQPGHKAYTFDPQAVRALAYVVPSGRLVIGTSSGELHLWDAAAQQSVSLLGKHNAPISSIAFHRAGGLISGDQAGTVISWDIGSGQMLATRSLSGSIGSVRWSDDGSELAVLVGNWTSGDPTHRLHLLDAEQLETRQSIALPSTIAVVPYHPRLGWTAVEWSGVVWSLTEGQAVDTLEKRLVSGAVMSQDLMPHTSTAGQRSGIAPQ